jgi:hypothetical protein
LTCNGDTPGPYTVTITGTSGSVTHMTNVRVMVTDNKILGLAPTIFYGTLGGIVALAAVASVVAILSIRKRR